MNKNPTPLALAAAVFAVCGAILALSPVSANNTSFPASTGYFPDEFVNQAKDIEPMPNTYGDTGLPLSLPEEAVKPASWTDSTPEMYS